jgi:AraC-like DNA-binding protein
METIATIGREIYPGISFGIRTSDVPEVLSEAYGQDIYQIMLVTEGSIVMGDGNDRSALLPPQIMCLSYLNPMTRFELRAAKGFSIFFVPRVINNGLFSESATASGLSPADTNYEAFLAERLLITPFRQGDISNPFHISANQILLDRLTGMYKGLRDQFTLQPNAYWPCRGRSYFLEILMLLQSLYAFEGGSEPELPLPKGNPVIEEAARTMLLRYPDPDFRMKEVAKPLGYLTFRSSFRRLAGMSPDSYLMSIRLTVAANLLRNTLLAPHDISERAGFPRMSVFESHFKRQHKKTPMQYRGLFPNPYG